MDRAWHAAGSARWPQPEAPRPSHVLVLRTMTLESLEGQVRALHRPPSCKYKDMEPAYAAQQLKQQPPPRLRRRGSLAPDDIKEPIEAEQAEQQPEASESPDKKEVNDANEENEATAEEDTSEDLASEPSETEIDESTSALRNITHQIAAELVRTQIDPRLLVPTHDHQVESALLASLYCQRATLLLAMSQYDATVDIPASLFGEHEQLSDDTETFEEHVVAVEQALDDALVAIALGPRAAWGYYLAAQCSRSLGKPANAMEFLVLARRLAPNDSAMEQLMRALISEQEPFDQRFAVAPPLKTEAIDIETVDRNDLLLTECLQVTRQLSDAAPLTKLELMLHHNVHHQCATADDVSGLQEMCDNVTELLTTKVLPSVPVSRLFSYTIADVPDTLLEATECQCVINERPNRKWLVQRLAPAVANRTRPIMAANDQISRDDAMADVVYDLLVLWTRLLLATGNLRRCTLVHGASRYIELAYDLSRQLGVPMPLETACADSFAMCLLDSPEEDHGEALLLLQESLQAAIGAHDARRELVCHYNVGKALMQMQEFDVAQEEFLQLLRQSQAMGESYMECLAQYELGEYFAHTSNVPRALKHFDTAKTLCHQTAHCQSTLRLRSIQDAIEFYSRVDVLPLRRRAVHLSPRPSPGRTQTHAAPPPAPAPAPAPPLPSATEIRSPISPSPPPPSSSPPPPLSALRSPVLPAMPSPLLSPSSEVPRSRRTAIWSVPPPPDSVPKQSTAPTSSLPARIWSPMAPCTTSSLFQVLIGNFKQALPQRPRHPLDPPPQPARSTAPALPVAIPPESRKGLVAATTSLPRMFVPDVLSTPRLALVRWAIGRAASSCSQDAVRTASFPSCLRLFQ